MGVMIGSARIDERGLTKGGAAGDQKQKAAPDYKGEVSQQPFYLHKKGWVVIRARDAEHARNLANRMITACDNPNIGYDQYQRDGVVKYGVESKARTECDCSSLVRECVKEATGIDPGNFTTANEREVLAKTGLFEKAFAYAAGTPLYTGDILVTAAQGHTVIVTSGLARVDAEEKKAADAVAREVIQGKWGNGTERKNRLIAAGYDWKEVQRKVNEILKK